MVKYQIRVLSLIQVLEEKKVQALSTNIYEVIHIPCG